MRDFQSNHPFIDGMVRAGQLEVSSTDHPSAAPLFSSDFMFHGPGGFQADLAGLAAYFAALRDAFADLTIRRAVAFGEGSFLATRTVFRGRFVKTFTMSPVGPVEPHGRDVQWEVMNIFRCDAQGRLAEEWVQMDVDAFIRELGIAR